MYSVHVYIHGRDVDIRRMLYRRNEALKIPVLVNMTTRGLI